MELCAPEREVIYRLPPLTHRHKLTESIPYFKNKLNSRRQETTVVTIDIYIESHWAQDIYTHVVK